MADRGEDWLGREATNLAQLLQDRVVDSTFLKVDSRAVYDLLDDGLVNISDRLIRHDGSWLPRCCAHSVALVGRSRSARRRGAHLIKLKER